MNATNIKINRTRVPNYNYVITGEIKGQEVKHYTNDSEVFDYLHNEEENEEKAEEALNYCQVMLEVAYNSDNQ